MDKPILIVSGVALLLILMLVAGLGVLMHQRDNALASLETSSVAVGAAQAAVETLQAGRDASAQESAALRASRADLEASFDALGLENAAMNQDLQDSRAESADALARLQIAVGELEGLAQAYNGAQARIDALEGASGTVEALRQRIQDLTTESDSLSRRIAQLHADRQPLLLTPGDTERSGFRCTGSMEPAISCEDEATWLRAFDPSAITVGTIISYGPPCWGGDGRAAHRVLTMEVRDGIRYYWPKGDANREPDGCWVPVTNVDSYLIELHPAGRPANALLREAVNAARAEHYRTLDAYYGLRDLHCERQETCRVPGPIYDELSGLRVAGEAAYAVYQCWRENALQSEYPGHIPNEC